MQRNLYSLFAILILLTSCKQELDIPTGDSDLELRSIDAVISTTQTRAYTPTPNNDYIGRKLFASGDRMVLAKMQRTSKPLVGFSYAGVNYGYSGSAWDRTVDGSGMPTDGNPERIFWSDNGSPHTFIGYAIPQSWGTATEVQTNGKWVNTADIYSGQFTFTEDPETHRNIVDFSSIPADIKDIKDKDNKVIGRIDSTGTRLKNEDLLLTHDTKMFADPGGLTTTLHYKHALASLRVIIDIQGFAPSTYSEDVKTRVDNLVVLNQPYKYTWHNAITDAKYIMGDGTEIPGWGVANSTTDADGTVDIKAWQPRPDGEGSGQAKVFTFYSLIVPGKQTNFSIKYKVHYPKYLNPAEIQDKDYQAQLLDANNQPVTINFLPGYTTTIRVSLNHEGEPVYIGAEYIDWENVETPDRSDLQKLAIFLDTDKRADVTIADDSKATKDDATWLYKDNGNVVDIYGNDGTAAKPYTIKTARQLLSFAYEVKSGRNFANQHVKLDSDIYLQKDLKTEDSTWPSITWPGIGDAMHKFNGYFDGGFRHVNYLYGAPFFNTIGEDGIVDHIFITNAIEIKGSGSIAEKNEGIICGSHVEGKVVETKSTEYCGSIVGVNTGVLVACTHIGDIEGNSNILGALLGQNDGIMVTCYNVGDAKNNKPDKPAYAGVGDFTARSIAYCCYFNQDFYTAQDYSDLQTKIGHVAFPLTTDEMQSNKFVNNPVVVDPEKKIPLGEITDEMPKDDMFYWHWSLNAGLARAVEYLSQELTIQSTQETIKFHAPGTNDGDGVVRVTLKKSQVQWLVNHYAQHSSFLFVPGTYPKLQ